MLVNCTPLGMHPNVDETPYEKHHLKPSMVVFDTVYNPESTLLIKDARSRSCTVVTGVEMFIRQAGPAIQDCLPARKRPAGLDARRIAAGDRRRPRPKGAASRRRATVTYNFPPAPTGIACENGTRHD